MKKVLTIILMSAIVISLFGCSNSKSNDVYYQATVTTTEKAAVQQTEKPTETPTEKQTESPTTAPTAQPTDPPKASIEWSDLTYAVKDNEGYLYEITYHLSPWILLSNTDTLNAAWNEVGKGNSLPGFNDWALTKKGNNYWRQLNSYLHLYGSLENFSAPMSDMYYCIGTVTITNKTDGFDITQSSPRSVLVPFKIDFQDKYDWAPVIGRIYYTDSKTDTYLGVHVNAKMQNNKWGPTQVIFMAPENYSPKYPDGQYIEPLLNSAYFRPNAYRFEYVTWNGTDISYGNDYPRVGLIDKDGIYRTE